MRRRTGRVSTTAIAVLVAVSTALPAGLACAGGPIVWSAGRRLRWSDFRASPPRGKEIRALSGWTIEPSGLRCGADGTFDARVRAVFLPDRSWVRGAASGALLAHEQGHFDLAEVYARRLRRRLRDEVTPYCPGKAAAAAAQRVYDDVLDAAERESARYDADTDHGQRSEQQRRWRQRISAALDRESTFRDR